MTYFLSSSWQSNFNFKTPQSFKRTEIGVTPAFFLVLELLLFNVIFLAFLIRWYLSASILSDPERALGAPRRFLNKEERKGTTGNFRPETSQWTFSALRSATKPETCTISKTALLVLRKRFSTLPKDQCETPKELYSEIQQMLLYVLLFFKGWRNNVISSCCRNHVDYNFFYRWVHKSRCTLYT